MVDAKRRTLIEFLPVIEGDPDDLKTFCTTLKECAQHVGVAFVTVDLPI